MTRKKYPVEIFVVRETDRDSTYLVAQETFADLAVVGESREVAVYKLLRIQKLTAKPELR